MRRVRGRGKENRVGVRGKDRDSTRAGASPAPTFHRLQLETPGLNDIVYSRYECVERSYSKIFVGAQAD